MFSFRFRFMCFYAFISPSRKANGTGAHDISINILGIRTFISFTRSPFLR